jgi:hypothetical protein
MQEDAGDSQQATIQEQIQGNDEVPSIDAVASSLAMLDTRGYHRTLLCDSNELLRRIVQPVSLPWMHKGHPISRNTAFDIDDMTETLMADDGSYTPHIHGPLGFGRYDVGQLRRGPLNTRLATSSDSLCSASRRSTEPGILEVSTVALQLFTARKAFHSLVPEEKLDLESNGTVREFVGVVNAPDGEISLRCYDRTSRRKRSKVAKVRRSARKHLVSVKVGSSSSRSSIFAGITLDTESRYGKMLVATLPTEVHNGKVLSNTNAQLVAERLGSYDWRHGLPKSSATTGKSPRTSCGRTRRVWTDRSGPVDQPQKVVHTSLLSGERLESGSQKRPREIIVAIRVEGEMFGSVPNEDELMLESQESAELGRTSAECVLDDEELVKNILADAQKSGSERSKARARVASAYPIIDCLPDSNGVIGVVCTLPGKVALSSVHEHLNHAAKMTSQKCCTVCWSPDHDQIYVVNECTDCGTLAHTQCCYDFGEIVATPAIDDSEKDLSCWRCAVCCFKKSQPSVQVAKSSAVLAEQACRSRRKSKLPQWLQDSHIDDTLPAGRPDHIRGEFASHGIKGVFCPYHGGAMSRVKFGEEIVWMHEVCRLWQHGALEYGTDDQDSKLQCALCGKTENRRSSNGSSDKISSDQRGLLIKCSGSRCQVYFHPMCALLSSKVNEARSESGDPSPGQYHPFTAQGIDQRLCASFTLSAVNCEAAAGTGEKDHTDRRLIQIPIGFCGIHNPKRVPTSRGLYQAGKHINNDSIRIPALRQGST